jgi:hypothetical protein
MIKGYIEQAIASIQAEKEAQINAVKTTVTQEKIIPYNTETDKLRDKAVAEKVAEFNAKVQELQAQLEQDKQEIITAAETDKTNNANTVITTETASISYKYDLQIKKLQDQMASIEE